MNGNPDRRLLQVGERLIECVVDWPVAHSAVDAAATDADTAAATTRSASTAARMVLGLAVVCHPHPLYGGTLDNKVAATLARTLASVGWLTVRFNFRGVGGSDGDHDHGQGETDDLLSLITVLQAEPDIQKTLAGSTVTRDAGHLANAANTANMDGMAASASRASVADTADAPALALAGFSFGSFVAAQAAGRLAEAGRTVEPLILVGAAAGKWPMPPVPSQTLVVHGELDETIALSDVMQWAAPLDLPVVVIPQADHFFHRRLTTLKRVVLRNLLGSIQAQSAPHSRGYS